jgi:hypothetical protein
MTDLDEIRNQPINIVIILGQNKTNSKYDQSVDINNLSGFAFK